MGLFFIVTSNDKAPPTKVVVGNWATNSIWGEFMKAWNVSLAVILITGCTTTKIQQPEFEASRVIERIGNVSETPEWSLGAEPLSNENGQVYFVSTITMAGDSRPEACISAASNLARVQILRQIKDHLTSSGQLSEESASSDPSLESLTAYLAQGTLSGVKVAKSYWEKREESDVAGMRVLRVRCASKVSIARSVLEKQLRAAIDGTGGGNPEVRKKLLEAQNNFLDSLSSGQAAANVKPASTPAQAQVELE